MLFTAHHRIAALGKPDIDRQRPIHGLLHETDHLRCIAHGNDRHVRNRAHDGDVVDGKMGRAERRIDDAAAVADQPDVDVVQAEVEHHLLEAAARDEGRDRVDVDDLPFEREAGRHADDVGLADAFHEEAVGHVPS